MVSDDSVIAIAPEQVSVDLDNEATILNLKTGVYYGLNEVGAFVWRLLEQPRSVKELKAAVLAEYEVDAERCHDDLQALLRDLMEHQLIEIRDAANA